MILELLIVMELRRRFVDLFILGHIGEISLLKASSRTRDKERFFTACPGPEIARNALSGEDEIGGTLRSE